MQAASAAVTVLLATLLVLGGCSRGGGGDRAPAPKDEPRTTGTGPAGGGEEGDQGGDEGEDEGGDEGRDQGGDEGGQGPVETELSFGLSLIAQDVVDPLLVTYLDVRHVIDANCTGCHAPGKTSPDLASFPFTSAAGESLDAIVAKVRGRMNDAARPMPPRGLLADDVRAGVDRWIDAGARPAPGVEEGVDAAAYKVFVRVEGGAWLALGVAADKRFTVKIGERERGAKLALQARVVGPEGREVLVKTLDPITVPADGFVRSQLYAPAEDAVAPVVGRRGELVVSRAGATSATVSWTAASDRRTPADSLEYRVYRSAAADIGTIQDAERNGTPVSAWVANLSFVRIDDLAAEGSVYLNVLVRDRAGNVAAYAMASAELRDETAPTPGGGLEASSLTAQTVVLKWVPATDDISEAGALEYLVVSSYGTPLDTPARAAAAVQVGAYAPGVHSRSIKGLVPQTKYGFNVLVRDAAGNVALYQEITVTTPALSGTEGPYDIVAYGKDCAERLGRLKPFSCLDGQIIPITNGGVVPADGYPAFAHGGSGEMACDRPALLPLDGSSQCAPYARLGRLDSYRADGSVNQDVDTVFICRRYKGRFGTFTSPADGLSYEASEFPGFEDVAIIQHDRKTGETCWFQMLESSSKDARRVPPPTEAVLPADAPATALSAKDFWLTPQQSANIRCIRCHDADAWIHTPYVSQVKGEDGKPLVPSNPFGPYKNIGRQFFTSWMTEGSFGNRAYAIDTTAGDNKCTTCHRIADKTCRTFARQSVGMTLPADASEHLSATFALSHWMPPASEGVTSVEAFESSGWKAHAQAIVDCCLNPNAAGCKRTPINFPPPPF